MKNLAYLFLMLGMIWSCSVSVDEQPEVTYCQNDYAEYYFNDVLFQTTYTPEGGEFLTPSGINCGITAVLDTARNKLILRIVGDGQGVNLHADVTNLNEEVEFSFVEYTNDNSSSTFNQLIPDHQNFIFIEEVNSMTEKIEGKFRFDIENSTGETMSITDGTFHCSYHKF